MKLKLTADKLDLEFSDETTNVLQVDARVLLKAVLTRLVAERKLKPEDAAAAEATATDVGA